MSPPRRFEPHNRVAGKYRLRRRIATGGMGEVWVARNESTGADVALKVLRRGDADAERETQAVERFRHEARLSAMLSHRSIVKVFDLLEEDDGALVLVMELLRGETLQDHLERRGPRSAREAVAVVSPILAALAHAHERGVVHRDVTPSNIFLAVDPDGHVTPKLVDFGIAKISQSGPPSRARPVQTLDGRVLGTPRYMAPEQIRSEEIDGRADVFGAAVVVYEAMTGVSPFAASSPAASLAAVLERHIDPDPRIEPRLWIELQRALSKRAYERHASAAELASALRAAVGETEGTLATCLSRAAPPADEPETDAGEVEARGGGAPSIDGQSVALSIPRRRVRGAAWWVAGIAAGAVASVVAIGIRGSGRAERAATPPSTAPAVGTASTTAVPTPSTSTVRSNALSDPAPSTSTSTSTSATATTASSHRSTRPRPVATTPGF
jgi:serine/threonine protein kinase